ncbi:MAG: hypothetical protein Q9162_005181 [Coniocarpon cinnabarinum]
MTDALCGPANPLQNFQKHAQADRTLQQDRLAPRQQHGPQGFRSENPGNAGMLDAEFEAFQNGQLPFAHLDGPQLDQQRPRSFQPPVQANGPHAGGWANDFARMQISSPGPQAGFDGLQQHQMAQPTAGASQSWHHDFAQSLQNKPAAAPQQPPTFQSRFSGSMRGASPFAHMQQPFGYQPSTFSGPTMSSEERWKGKGRWQAEDSQQTAAFEAEFEVMAKEQLRQLDDQPLEDGAIKFDTVQDPMAKDTSAEHNVQPFSPSLAPELSSEFDFNKFLQESDIDEALAKEKQAKDEAYHEDQTEEQLREMDSRLSANGLLPRGWAGETMKHMPSANSMQPIYPAAAQEPPRDSQQQQKSNTDVDADLAHTAAVLLHSVSDNQSPKFQNSTFLCFMRQLRDHEVKVDGDKVVDVPQPQPQAEIASSSPQQEEKDRASEQNRDADLGRFRPENRSEPVMSEDAAAPRKMLASEWANMKNRPPPSNAYVEDVADQMGLSRAVTDAWMRQDSYMRPGGHPVDDF